MTIFGGAELEFDGVMGIFDWVLHMIMTKCYTLCYATLGVILCDYLPAMNHDLSDRMSIRLEIYGKPNYFPTLNFSIRFLTICSRGQLSLLSIPLFFPSFSRREYMAVQH
jgi:hypothetical protein